MEKKGAKIFWLNCWPYIVALAVGLAVFGEIYPVRFLKGEGAYFSCGDAAQHVSGWFLYADDAWRFPILKTERIMYPAGESIAFTDSIPIMAIPFKLIGALLPAGFHYFGIWHLMMYCFQAIAGAFFIRSCQAPKWAMPVGAFFAVTFPAFTWRIGHSALMCHALIIFSLGIYLRAALGRMRLNEAVVWLIVLQIIGLLTHPYFFPMIAGVWIATLLDCRSQLNGFTSILKIFFIPLICIGLILFLGGYLNGTSMAVGFGDYSMNLWAPFTGGSFTPSFVDATNGQGEGFNYLGVGGLSLIFLSLLTTSRLQGKYISRHAGLGMVLHVLFMYSLSCYVYAGHTLIVDFTELYNPVKFITGAFRSSGRFFWPVGYILLLGATGLISRKKTCVAVSLLTLAAWIQWNDTAGLRASVHEIVSKPSVVSRQEIEIKEAIKGSEVIKCIPSSTGVTREGDHFILMMQRIAAEQHIKISGGYLARQRTTGLVADSQAETIVALASLAEVASPALGDFLLSKMSTGELMRVGDYLVYRKNWSRDKWAKLYPPATPYFKSTFYAVGYVTLGPYIQLPKGSYVATVEYKVSDDAFAFSDISIGGSAASKPIRLTPESTMIDIPFEIVSDGVVEVRTNLKRGSIEIKGMKIKRAG